MPATTGSAADSAISRKPYPVDFSLTDEHEQAHLLVDDGLPPPPLVLRISNRAGRDMALLMESGSGTLSADPTGAAAIWREAAAQGDDPLLDIVEKAVVVNDVVEDELIVCRESFDRNLRVHGEVEAELVPAAAIKEDDLDGRLDAGRADLDRKVGIGFHDGQLTAGFHGRHHRRAVDHIDRLGRNDQPPLSCLSKHNCII